MPDNNQADGFSVVEKAGNNLIVGKMLKFTVDSKYKADKADDLPDGTTLVAIDVTTAWVKWLGEKPTEHRITRPGQVHPDRDDFTLPRRRENTLSLRCEPLPVHRRSGAHHATRL
jgi:hypothetical protein